MKTTYIGGTDGHCKIVGPSYAIDWDGTCVSDSWPKMGKWQPGAIEALRELSGFARVLIHTCRIAPADYGTFAPRDPLAVDREIAAIRSMLNAAGLDAVEIWTKPYKPPAVAYVDNRAVHYNGRKGAWAALVPKLKILAGVDPGLDDD